MACDLRNRIRKCGRCKRFEATPPVAPLRPLACSGQGELLHVDFTSIEETVPLCEEPVIRNVMVMQDHFSKYVVTYVVKDQMGPTAAETLRNGYFGLFGAPAYLVSDQGKAFTGHLISNLCELYGVQKLRTLPYHAQTNGQVERMNQMIIRMIRKLELQTAFSPFLSAFGCLLVFLFLLVRSVRWFWGMVVRSFAHRDLC